MFIFCMFSRSDSDHEAGRSGSKVGPVILRDDLRIQSSAIVSNLVQAYAHGDFAEEIVFVVLQRSHFRSPDSGIYPNGAASRPEDDLP